MSAVFVLRLSALPFAAIGLGLALHGAEIAGLGARAWALLRLAGGHDR